MAWQALLVKSCFGAAWGSGDAATVDAAAVMDELFVGCMSGDAVEKGSVVEWLLAGAAALGAIVERNSLPVDVQVALRRAGVPMATGVDFARELQQCIFKYCVTLVVDLAGEVSPRPGLVSNGMRSGSGNHLHAELVRVLLAGSVAANNTAEDGASVAGAAPTMLALPRAIVPSLIAAAKAAGDDSFAALVAPLLRELAGRCAPLNASGFEEDALAIDAAYDSEDGPASVQAAAAGRRGAAGGSGDADHDDDDDDNPAAMSHALRSAAAADLTAALSSDASPSSSSSAAAGSVASGRSAPVDRLYGVKHSGLAGAAGASGPSLLTPTSFSQPLQLLSSFLDDPDVVQLLLKAAWEDGPASGPASASSGPAGGAGAVLPPSFASRMLHGIVKQAKDTGATGIRTGSGGSAGAAASSDAASAAAVAISPLPIPTPGATGIRLQSGTFLGRLLSLGPQRRDFVTSDGRDLLATLATLPALPQHGRHGAEEVPVSVVGGGRGAGGDDDDDGGRGAGAAAGSHDIAALVSPADAGVVAAGADGSLPVGVPSLIPPVVSAAQAANARRALGAAVADVVTQLRSGAATYTTLVKVIIEKILKRGPAAREAVFTWFGAVLDANAPRSTMPYTGFLQSPPQALVFQSSPSLLFNVSRVLLGLCEPFLEPTGKLSARVDLRYLSDASPVRGGAVNGNGGGRYSMTKEARAAPFVDHDGDGADGVQGGGVVGATWLDVRNLARQQEFIRRHKAMMRQAELAQRTAGEGAGAAAVASAAAVGSSPSPMPPGTPGTAACSGGVPATDAIIHPLAYAPIAEFYGLTLRALHLSHVATLQRLPSLTRALQSFKQRRDDTGEELWSAPNRGLTTTFSGSTGWASFVAPRYELYRHITRRIGRVTTAMALAQIHLFDPEVLSRVMAYYRLHAVVLVRAVTPTHMCYVAGALPVESLHVLGGTPRLAVDAAVAAAGGAGAPAGVHDALATLVAAASAGASADATSPAPLTPLHLTAAATASSSGAPATPQRGPSGSATATTPVPGGTPAAGGAGTVSVGSPAPSAAGGAAAYLPLPTPTLPLPPPSPVWCGVPEYALSDVAEVFRAVAFHRDNAVSRVIVEGGLFGSGGAAPLADFLTAFVTFLGAPLHVHNPYLRGRFLQAVQVFVPHRDAPWRHEGDPSHVDTGGMGRRYRVPLLHTVLRGHANASAYLVPAIAAFIVDIGHSGSHTAFYDKFDYRETAADVLDYVLRSCSTYNPSLLTFASSPSSYPNWLKTANEIVSDTSYHLEEVFKALATVRSIEREQDTPALWASLSQEEQRDKGAERDKQRGMARYHLHHASLQAELLALLSGRTTHALLSRHLRGRVAANLGFLLDALVGNKRNELRVKDMGSLGFNPREVLLNIIMIFNHLADAGPRGGQNADEPADAPAAAAASGGDGTAAADDAGGVVQDDSSVADLFAQAIIRDERSFRIANFTEACRVLSTPDFVAVHPEASWHVAKIPTLVKRIERAQAADVEEEEEMGDVPDELCDPLMATIMIDPVLLPTSRKICDRETISRVLLDEARDPFNRMPLAAEDLKPVPEMRKAIADWKAAKKRGDEAAAAAAVKVARKVIGEDDDDSDGSDADDAMRGGGGGGAAAASAPAPAAPASTTAGAAAASPAATSSSGAGGSRAAGSPIQVDDDEEEDNYELEQALAMSMAPPAAAAVAAAATRAAMAPPAASVLIVDDDAEEDEDELARALRLSMEHEAAAAATTAVGGFSGAPRGAAAAPGASGSGVGGRGGGAAADDDDEDLQAALAMSMNA